MTTCDCATPPPPQPARVSRRSQSTAGNKSQGSVENNTTRKRNHQASHPLTGSRVHVLVPAPPHELSESPGPLLLEGRPPPPLDDALHELLAVQALERPPQAQHLPQDQAEAVNISLSTDNQKETHTRARVTCVAARKSAVGKIKIRDTESDERPFVADWTAR